MAGTTGDLIINLFGSIIHPICYPFSFIVGFLLITSFLCIHSFI